MGIELRKVRRSIEEKAEKAAIKDPLSGEQMELGAHAKSQEEIWQDPEDQAKFLQFLGAKDGRKARPIIDALTTGRLLTESQQAYIDKSISGFNIRRAEMGRLEQIFTPDYVRDIADTNKSFGLMIKQIGLERAHGLLKNQLEKLSLEDAKSYAKLVKSMSEERTLTSSHWAQTVDAKVSEALRKTGIPEEELGRYVEKSLSFSSGFDSGEKSMVERTARESMNTLMKVADIISGSAISHRRARNFIESFQHQRDLLQKSNLHLADIAKVLKASITPEMRLEMQRVMIEGGEMKELPETNVNTIPEYKEARDAHTQAEREKRFKEHMKAELKKLKKGPGGASAAEKDQIKNDFVENEFGAQEKRKGRGIFAALLALVFKTKADLRSEADSIWP